MKQILVLLLAVLSFSCNKNVDVLPQSDSPFVAEWTKQSDSYNSVYEGLDITDNQITFHYDNFEKTYYYYLERFDDFQFSLHIAEENDKESIIGKWAIVHTDYTNLFVDLNKEFCEIDGVITRKEDKALVFEK